jgi:hypothetical protein
LNQRLYIQKSEVFNGKCCKKAEEKDQQAQVQQAVEGTAAQEQINGSTGSSYVRRSPADTQ